MIKKQGNICFLQALREGRILWLQQLYLGCGARQVLLRAGCAGRWGQKQQHTIIKREPLSERG